MPQYIITENQLKVIRKEVLSEAKWYNTVMDVLGLVDPTPTIDFVNGLSYINQGDNLFGILSLISAFPGVGDLLAKPVTLALKTGSKSADMIELALKESKMGNNEKAIEILSKVAKDPSSVGEFVRKGGEWSPRAAEYLNKLPLGPFGGLRTTILNWFGLFEKAGTNSKLITKGSGEMVSKLQSSISQDEKIQLLTQFLGDAKKTNFFNPQNFYKSSQSLFNLWGGMPRIFGNREARTLVRKTKFWAGFLDFLGLGNFTGPEEVEKKLGSVEAEQMMKKYQETPQAKKLFEEDFLNVDVSDEVGFVKNLINKLSLDTLVSLVFGSKLF